MGDSRTKRSHKILGLILIGIGLILIVNQQGLLSWPVIRSYGFLIFGLLLILRSLSDPYRRGLFSSVVILVLGGYFTGAQWNIYSIDRGLSITVFVFSFGLAFYGLFLFKQRRWDSLIYGNLFIFTGLLFLLAYLNIIPSDTFITIVDDYWPLLIVFFGLGLIVKSMRNSRKSQTMETAIPKNSATKTVA